MSPLAKETGQTLVPGYVVSDDPTFIQVGDAAVLKVVWGMKLVHPACCMVGLKQTNANETCFLLMDVLLKYFFLCAPLCMSSGLMRL